MKDRAGPVQTRCASVVLARHLLLAAVVLASGSLLWIPASSQATEDQSYEALLQWIENKRPEAQMVPGQHLTVQDRENLLEPLIPRPAWKYYIFDDVDMEIAATAHYPPPADWGKNVPSDYELDDNGVLVGFTGGGFPFEEITADDPQAAQKVVWNMIWRPGTQDYSMPMVASLRGEHGRLDRTLEFQTISSAYALGDHCLVPGYEEVKHKRVTEFRTPRDMAGAKNMSIGYVDHYREDARWLYLPAQRKPRRTLASERTGEFMGMDKIPEDYQGFGGKVHENNLTYLGKRAVLATNNVRDNPEIGGPHLWVPHKARWEVRDTHVVLMEPKADNHPYSHRIVFIDAETYWAHWLFTYDREQKQLYRMAQHFLKYSESYATGTATQAPYVVQDFSKNVGHNVFMHVGNTDIDATKPHATITQCYVARRDFSPGRARQFYSLRNMVSGRR